MNMTSRITLVASAGLIWAGCSASGEGDIADPPSQPPPGGFGGQVAAAGTGGAPAGGTGGAPAGGTGGAPAGGTGGAPAGGTGGAPAGGTGGAPATDGVVPVGDGVALTPQADGWVPGESNGLGVQGAFFSASDADANPTGTTIDLDTATTLGSVCVSGSLAAIADMDFATYWGATVGLNLRQVLPPGGGEALPASGWPRTTPEGTVSAFSYTITANNGVALPELRFTVDFVGKAAGDTYCDPIAPGGTSTALTEVVQSCWEPTTVTLPAADLLAIQWSLIPSQTAAVPFDFCITNLQGVVQ
jgi:hypothetical protein